ncbi:puromycin-sensitive aminopeptidase-like [Zophobas morio]|uniref:puromycin-sensitive aminopeptidase-like n=1 Tax=Zophobas morio TaxID=2755281 RepID=UPI0030832BAF
MVGKDTQPFRQLLPNLVKPISYDITIKPDFDQFTFLGTSSIEIKVFENTQEIILHAVDLEILECTLKSGKDSFDKSRLNYNKDDETVTLYFKEKITVGKYQLDLSFNGQLNDKMVGFYRSKYEKNGEYKFCGVTQFEPTDARRAFPCFDEPSLKATFVIRLDIPVSLIGLSNMPVDFSETRGDTQLITYKPTPIMSTYLIAFVIGEYDFVESKTERGVTVRVFTEVGKSKKGKFALACACKILDFYTDYFDLGYPLEKVDMIAISDFSAGAMENWGLITYRETALLIDEATSSLASKQRVAYVVAHELAHQWFGNLVTMAWWNDLWLNEGFATWVGNLAVDFLYKEWDAWPQFVQEYTSSALQLDSLRSSHPIEVEVRRSSEVNEIFDAISYCKGASVIRMLAAHLGMDVFREGLRGYLKKHQYGNAATKDLWCSLSEASNKDIVEFTYKWTKETGYPVIMVTRTAKDTLSVTQKRFLATGEALKEEKAWQVPLSVTGDGTNTVFRKVLSTFEDTLRLPEDLAKSTWLKLNVGFNGFYRVKYSDELFSALSDALITQVLPTVDRLGIANDAFALSRAGYIRTDKVLSLIEYFKEEKEYTVWVDITENLRQVQVLYEEHEAKEKLQTYMRQLYSPIAHEVGWEPEENEHPLRSLLRSVVISALGLNGDAAIIDVARDRFAKYLEDPASLIPDLRSAVFSIVVANGGKHEFDSVRSIFYNADMHEERMRALSALGRTEIPQLVDELLKMGHSEAVRPSDLCYVYGSLSSNGVARPLAWKYMKEHFPALKQQFGNGQFLLCRMIEVATKNFASKEKAQEIREFFTVHPTESALRTIENSIERVMSNAAWLERDRQHVFEYLRKR